jgi:D-alanyl-D-alanine carboxypeptidase (penicillin-binding protein 5/6)
LYKNIGADGIKTGFLTVEKYSLASSIKVGARRLNAVASGFETRNSRSKESIKILTWGLRSFDTIQIAKKNEVIANLDVWLGIKNKVEAIILENVYVTVPKRKKKIIKAVIEYNTPIETPIAKGDKLGSLNIYVAGDLKKKIDVLSGEEIKKANIFLRLLKSFNFPILGN